jgi:general stress protein 26
MIDRLWQIVDAVAFPLLVTIGKDGCPRGRPMALLRRDENVLWFATSRASRKVAQIKADSRVTVMCVDTAHFNHASVRGRAEIVDDPAMKNDLWREEWRDQWDDSSDSDYVLLKVIGESGAYYHGDADELEKIEF